MNLRRETQAYRMARRILRATNRLPGAGRGPALRWCAQRRYVLADLAQRTRAALGRRRYAWDSIQTVERTPIIERKEPDILGRWRGH